MEVLYQLSYVGASPDPIGIVAQRSTFLTSIRRKPEACVARA